MTSKTQVLHAWQRVERIAALRSRANALVKDAYSLGLVVLPVALGVLIDSSDELITAFEEAENYANKLEREHQEAG